MRTVAAPFAPEHGRIALCADDFALTAGVSHGILELLAAGRISATGVMTNRPHWAHFARALMAFSGQADLGLHLNLTTAAPIGPMPYLATDGNLPRLGTLARSALASKQARTEIGEEINRQLDAFEDKAGRAPDFVDGHQHVHTLPGIRGQVIAAIARRYQAGSVYLRDPTDSPLAIVSRGVAVRKALVINMLGAGLARQASAEGIPLNQGFSGFSPFEPARDFASDFRRFLIMPGPRHLVMCHPGHADDELPRLDGVVETREMEWRALMGL